MPHRLASDARTAERAPGLPATAALDTPPAAPAPKPPPTAALDARPSARIARRAALDAAATALAGA